MDSSKKITFSTLFTQIKNRLVPYLFQVFLIFIELSGIICYAISLQGCNLSQSECLAKYTINTVYVLFFLLSTSSLSYITCVILVKKKIINWYHLAATSSAYFVLFFVNFGANLDKHGIFNILVFLVLDVIFFIMYLILNSIYLLIKKKKYIILTIIFSIVLFICLMIFPNSCRNFYKGLGGKKINNDPEENGCEFPYPKFCLLSRFDNLIDYSRLTFYSCKKHNKNEKKIFLKYLNKSLENATRFAYPSTIDYNLSNQINMVHFNKDTLNAIIDLDSEDPKIHHEVTLEFDKNNEGTIHIDVQKNETLVQERQEIRKNLNKQMLYKNILIIYIDAISRQHFLRKMKETQKFIEQYIYDSSKENNKERVSFQFFKYHSFSSWTHISVTPMFYGESMVNANGTNLIKYFKEHGYITGMTENTCTKELYDIEKSDPYNKNRGWVKWDHENIAIFCDTNYFDYNFPYGPWKGQNAALRRCLYGRDTYEYAIEYAEKFWEAYKDEPKFFRLGIIDAHEDTLEVIKYVDKPIREMINRLDEKRLLEDTALIFVSDHGNGLFGFTRIVSPDFDVEKVLPTLFIVLPNSKDEKMIEHFNKLEKNSQKFVSSYDIHDTLLYMLYYHDVDRKNNYSLTGQTLFEEIDGLQRKCSTYKDFELGICVCKKFNN